MIIVFKFIKESLLFAWNALTSNKLRTILTLSGVTIGIFSIISVFTLIDYLESRIRDSIQSLGDNVVYVQKWPWTPPEGETEYPWWRYMNRPLPTLNEQKVIERHSQLAASSTFAISAQKKIIFEANSFDKVQVLGVSNSFDQNWNFEISRGRYFTSFESSKGSNITIIGADIADELFQDTDPIGKRIKMAGRQLTVVGVILRQGKDIFGNSLDTNIIIPIQYAKNIFNIRSERVQPFIVVKAKERVNTEDLMSELEGILRAERKIKPQQGNTFALNRMSIIQKQFDDLFGILNIAGGFIGFFAILVGGFGIANIMFVSVKERTRIIGIQKALGAKRRFILWQFLFESIFLSLLGGTTGLALIFIIIQIANSLFDLSIPLTFWNIFRALFISIFLGIISGYIPSNSASKLNPVDAINN
ncbi:ABC transporter permease [Saccharicrinis fermentans]|uniref:Macrolide export ATP-binding/permease protein MacB n=1 Tax=Saccharicrinis fermentans DSM 9555 = JCM 21142 TaxID=869213 RepID=W7YIA6_9BACT|nr:ABC transporter permease [Saccharicrinis fermentans]GAF04206.1 macrolide export ATP-binding/permease protein MacB [Saccharicrinis fermentans DSM 9555 = JCM 21142]